MHFIIDKSVCRLLIPLMNIIILTDKDRRDDDNFFVSDHRAEHIRTILELHKGDYLEVGILNGPKGNAKIEGIDERGVTIHIENIYRHDNSDAGMQIDIICALPRPQTLKKILITCGMMNVHRLYLIRASRVEKSYYHSPLLDPENYKPFLIEGLSQGKFTRLPEVRVFQRFKPFFEDIFPEIEKETGHGCLKLLPDSEAEDGLSVIFKGNSKNIILAIGPEGGWVPFEIELMESRGFRRFSLGPWVLRVEHALTAVLAQIEAISSIEKHK
jgi:16S rRNA (uracil1498-N3)-methyltransferase